MEPDVISGPEAALQTLTVLNGWRAESGEEGKNIRKKNAVRTFEILACILFVQGDLVCKCCEY